MKSFFVLAFACVFVLPMTASVTDAAFTVPVWGGSTFARGDYTTGYARTVAGTLNGVAASSAERLTNTTTGSYTSVWGTREVSDGLFRYRAEAQSTVVFDPAATVELERGATARVTLRYLRINYIYWGTQTRVNLTGNVTATVSCPLNGAAPTVDFPETATLMVAGSQDKYFAMPEANSTVEIANSGTMVGVTTVNEGSLVSEQTVTNRSASTHIYLKLIEKQAGLEVWNIQSTLVKAECGTGVSGSSATSSVRDSLTVNEPDDDEEEGEEVVSDCKPYLLGIGGAGQRDYERENKPTFVGGILERYSDRMETHSLDYPSSVWPLGPYTKEQSVAEGTEAAEELINDFKERCPDGRVVVVGHSLGAEIAGNLARQVDRAVVFGDPRAPGGIYSAFSGIIPGISGPGERNPEPNLVSVCNEYSLICDCPAPWVDPLHLALSLQGFLSGKHTYDYSLDEALGLAPGHYFKQRENPNPALPEHFPLPDIGLKLPLPFQLPEWKPGPLPNIQDLPGENQRSWTRQLWARSMTAQQTRPTTPGGAAGSGRRSWRAARSSASEHW